MLDPVAPGTVLVVDDNADVRASLSALLEAMGYAVTGLGSGEEALTVIRRSNFDLLILDILMPGLDGFAVLEQLKGDPVLRDLPVVVLSGVGELEAAARCIELGAEDFLHKPVKPVLLRARLRACLDRKRALEREREALRALEAEKEKSEQLLRALLPASVVDRLKAGETHLVDNFPEMTVGFADLVGFSRFAVQVSPHQLVCDLDNIFTRFDRLAVQSGVEKIKTIGDAYMFVGRMPPGRSDHAMSVAEMALAMQDEIVRFNEERDASLSLRVGINTGPVIAGILGESRFTYDLWGDTVNVASRMQSSGYPAGIQVTETTYERLKDDYYFAVRGRISVKGRGDILTYLLMGKRVAGEEAGA